MTNNTNLDNIIEVMVAQHRVLQKDLGTALELSKEQITNFSVINDGLLKFSIDLPEHLQLENDIFYPELLNRMKNKGVDTSKTQEFINQMIEIGVAVSAFLVKYKDAQSINGQFESFKKEIPSMVSALNLRIESEESGVYDYWEIYK